MHIIAVQMDIAWEHPAANRARVREMLASKPPQPGSLVVLPELFSVGFTMEVEAKHEPEGGPTEVFLHEMARTYQVCMLAGVLHRAEDGRGLNRAVAVAPEGEVLVRYSKIHPFSFAGEHKHFAPGDRVMCFNWQGVTIAPLVCYDLRFPEVFRQAARLGAQVIAVIANWPSRRVSHWHALGRARAIENQSYLVAVNRVGRDPNVDYPGCSMIIDPLGGILAQADDQQGMIEAEADIDRLSQYRARFPALADMRDDFVPKLFS